MRIRETTTTNQSSGTPGSSASWESKASGGVNQSLPLPPALVFSESVTLNGQTHTSAPMSPFFSASSVSGETSDGELNAGVAFESPTLDITPYHCRRRGLLASGLGVLAVAVKLHRADHLTTSAADNSVRVIEAPPIRCAGL